MHRRLRTSELGGIFDRIRAEEDLPIGFSPAAVTDARFEATGVDRADLRHIPFVTIDPPGSMDLDQAMALAPLPHGSIRVNYAIADVASFVEPGGALDQATRERGTTVYCPDIRVPLHPPSMSEASASLLPDKDRPAIVWELDVDRDGDLVRSHVRRAMVRSRQRLNYVDVQRSFDAGSPPEPIALLDRFGRARIERGVERGALTLRLPEQEALNSDNKWTIVNLAEMPVERWNAQVSLLTGMTAADMMLDAGVGILRTLPMSDSDALGRLRASAKALGIAWSRDDEPAAVLAELDPSNSRHLALFQAATGLLRGAAYLAFGEGRPEGDIGHAGLATTYSHVTAPLRRLVDRFGLEVCVSVARNSHIPGWVREGLEELPGVMAHTGRRARKVESRCIDAVEAWVLRDRVGERFEAIVMDTSMRGSEVWIDEPPVLTWVDGLQSKPGRLVDVTVVATDPENGDVHLEEVA